MSMWSVVIAVVVLGVLVGAALLALALCRMSAIHARREEREEVERLIQEGRG